MADSINSCSCAEEAVDMDIEESVKSKIVKSKKDVAHSLFGDKTLNQAHQYLINMLNPNQEYPRMGAEQAIRICLICGHSDSYLQYVFNNLKALLNAKQSKDFILLVFDSLIKNLSSEDAEVIATHVNVTLGFNKPRVIDGPASIEARKEKITNKIMEKVKSIHNDILQIQELEKLFEVSQKP